jgi:hypothetical protein
VAIPNGVTKITYRLRVTPNPIEDNSPLELIFEAPTKLVVEEGIPRGQGMLRIDGNWNPQQHDDLLRVMADAAVAYMAETWPALTVDATRRYTAEHYPAGDPWPSEPENP